MNKTPLDRPDQEDMDGILTTEHHDEVYLRTVEERCIRNKASAAVPDGYKGSLQTGAALPQRAGKEDQLLPERHGRLPNLGVPKRDNIGSPKSHGNMDTKPTDRFRLSRTSSVSQRTTTISLLECCTLSRALESSPSTTIGSALERNDD